MPSLAALNHTLQHTFCRAANAEILWQWTVYRLCHGCAYTPSCNAARCHACHLRIQHDWALVFKPALQLPMGMIIGNGHRDAKATALTHKLAVVYSRLFAHRNEHITYQPLHIFPAQSMQASVCVAVPADLPGENKHTEACGGMRQRRGRCVDFTVFLL